MADEKKRGLDDRPVRAGDVLAGKYRVERELGAGAMGFVVAAVHTGLHQNVAVKVLRPELAAQPELGERFLREARAAASLRSEHCVRVFDVDVVEMPARDGEPAIRLPYIIMELLEGCDLRARMERGSLPFFEAAGLVADACEAVGEAHQRGLVHRDLKPENLFIATGAEGEPIMKVLDFGISRKAYGAEELRLKAEGTFLGTPLYMAPEQMRGAGNVDARCDVWSLGAVLYELLTGRPPFSGTSLAEVCARVMTEPVVPPRALCPEVPPGLEAIVLTCLEKDPERRYASARALGTALRAALSATPPGTCAEGPTAVLAPAAETTVQGEPLILPAAGTGTVRTTESSAPVSIAVSRLARGGRRSRARLFLALGLFLGLASIALAGAFATLLWKRRSAEVASTPASSPTVLPAPATAAPGGPAGTLPDGVSAPTGTLDVPAPLSAPPPEATVPPPPSTSTSTATSTTSAGPPPRNRPAPTGHHGAAGPKAPPATRANPTAPPGTGNREESRK